MVQKKKICCKVYFNPESWFEVTELAKNAGFRHGGSLTHRKKPHGFEGETQISGKGISKFLKYTVQYWKATEAARMAELADLLKQREEIEKRIKSLEIKS